MIKSNLKFIDVRFQLLLDAKSLSLGARLSFKRGLQRVHGTLVVLTSVVELFFLLLNLPVNFLANLAKLKLSPQDLVLFLLKGSLSFLKSSLKFFLLNFKAPPLFVKLMDGATTITKLIKQVLDLISKVLVLPLDNVKLFSGLIPSSLQPEELRVVVAALLLAGLNLSSKIINLGLPFTNNLVKVPASLLSNDSSSMHSLILKLDVLKLSFKTVLGLLSAGDLLVQSFNGLFSLLQAGIQLLPTSIKFINALLQLFQLRVQVLEPGKEGSPITGL